MTSGLQLEFMPCPVSRGFLLLAVGHCEFLTCVSDRCSNSMLPHYLHSWRLSVYYLLTRDARIQPALMAQSSFFGSLHEIHAGYHLNGQKIHDRNYCDMSFTAPASVVMWTMCHPHQERIQQAMEDLESDRSYFGDSIQLLCLLQARNPRGF